MAKWESDLETILAQPPSAQGWRQLCKVLGTVRSASGLKAAIARANEGLEAWPDTIRLPSSRWLASLLTDKPNPRLAVVRAVRFGWSENVHVDRGRIKQLMASMEPLTITHLELSRQELGALGVRTLASSPALQHVRVLNLARAFTEGVTAMPALAASRYANALIHLDISNTGTTDRGFAALVDAPWFPQLETLRVTGDRSMWRPTVRGLTNTSVEALVAHPTLALRELDLASNRIDDAGVELLATCEALAGLRKLNLYENPTSPAARQLVLASPHLDQLEQRDAFLVAPDAPWPNDEAANPVELLTTLRDLLYKEPSEELWMDLVSLFEGFEPTPDWMVALNYAAEHLEAWPSTLRVTFGEVGLSVLTAAPDPRLRLGRTVDVPMAARFSTEQLANFQRSWDTFGFEGLRLSGWGVTPLRDFFTKASIRGVRRLDLSNCFTGGITLLRALARADWLEGLVELDLSMDQLGVEGLVAIAGSPVLSHVERLRLTFNRGLSVRGAQVIAGGFTNLRELYVASTDLFDGGVIVLANARHLARLEVLDLSDNDFGSDGAAALGESPYLGHLRELTLSGNPIGDRGLCDLVASPSISALEVLALAECGVGDEGVRALCQANLPSLRTLELDMNYFDGAALIGLAEASFARTLTELRLGDGPIGDDGAQSIADAPLTGLRTLTLNASEVTSVGALALARSPHLSNLRELELSSNDLSDAAIAELIQRFRRLTRLEVWGCEAGALTRAAAEAAHNLDDDVRSALAEQTQEWEEPDTW